MDMITNEYELAWVLYGVAALGCFWVWTFFTRWMWRYLRELLWLAVAVVLFTPTLADPNGTAYVPALAMAAMDIVFKVNHDAWRAVADMTLYGLIALAVYCLFALLRFVIEYYWLKPRARAKASAADAAEQQQAQLSTAESSLGVAESELTMQERLALERSPLSGIVAQR